MTHLFLLGAKVLDAGLERLDDAGDALGNPDSRGFYGGDLVRVVRQQSYLLNTKETQYFAGQVVIAEIGVKPELVVGLDGVGALVLDS